MHQKNKITKNYLYFLSSKKGILNDKNSKIITIQYNNSKFPLSKNIFSLFR
jgi:hypothetical protein